MSKRGRAGPRRAPLPSRAPSLLAAVLSAAAVRRSPRRMRVARGDPRTDPSQPGRRRPHPWRGPARSTSPMQVSLVGDTVGPTSASVTTDGEGHFTLAVRSRPMSRSAPTPIEAVDTSGAPSAACVRLRARRSSRKKARRRARTRDSRRPAGRVGRRVAAPAASARRRPARAGDDAPCAADHRDRPDADVRTTSSRSSRSRCAVAGLGCSSGALAGSPATPAGSADLS